MTAHFDDGKDDGALRTIGEVSRALGIKTHVLRYWEQQFPMLEPLKRSGGRRYYRTEDVDLIETINRLVNEEGYTLKGAQQAIDNGGQSGEKPETAENTDSAAAPDNASEAFPVDTPKRLLDDDIAPASDGGVANFFGNTPENEESGEAVASEPESDDSSDRSGLPQAELLAKLKAMRSRLEAALAG